LFQTGQKIDEKDVNSSRYYNLVAFFTKLISKNGKILNSNLIKVVKKNYKTIRMFYEEKSKEH